MRLHVFSFRLLWEIMYARSLWFVLGMVAAVFMMTKIYEIRIDRERRAMAIALVDESVRRAEAAYRGEPPVVAVWALGETLDVVRRHRAQHGDVPLNEEGGVGRYLYLEFLLEGRLAMLYERLERPVQAREHGEAALAIVPALKLPQLRITTLQELYDALGIMEMQTLMGQMRATKTREGEVVP